MPITRKASGKEGKPRGKSTGAVNDASLQDRILKSARHCFRRNGVQATKVDDVAKEVGISRPLIYKIYGNRQALLEAVIADEVSRIIELQRICIAKCTTFNEAIIEGSICGIEASRKAYVLTDLMSSKQAAQMPDLVLDPEKPFYELATAIWKPVFQRGRETGEIAKTLTDEDLYEWLMSIHAMFLLRSEIDTTRIRRLLTLFLSFHRDEEKTS